MNGSLISSLTRRMLYFEEGVFRWVQKCTSGKDTLGAGRNVEECRLTKDERIHLKLDTGRNLKKDPLTDEEVDWLLDSTLEHLKVVQVAMATIGLAWGALNAVRQAVVISMVYQLGATKFLKFTGFISSVKAAQFEAAAGHIIDSKQYRSGVARPRWDRLAAAMRTGVAPSEWS